MGERGHAFHLNHAHGRALVDELVHLGELQLKFVLLMPRFFLAFVKLRADAFDELSEIIALFSRFVSAQILLLLGHLFKALVRQLRVLVFRVEERVFVFLYDLLQSIQVLLVAIGGRIVQLFDRDHLAVPPQFTSFVVFVAVFTSLIE